MSRHHRPVSIISGLALIWSLIFVIAPPAAQAQTSEPPCAGIAEGNCILVERSDDPYPVDPDNPTDAEVVAAGNQNILCSDEAGLDCSLRAAIMKANNRTGSDPVRIIFSINQNQPGYDDFSYQGQIIETWTVFVVEPLPPLTRDRIEINGFSQEDALLGTQNDFGPTIVIDGALLTQPSRGLTINSSNNIVRGLGITGFDVVSATAGVGIEIARDTATGNPATGNEIYGCYIGVNAVGTAAAPNARGMWIQSDNNIIGGQLSRNGTRNLISGNLLDGIWITAASGNKVRGTYVGVDRFGQTAIQNGSSGAGSGIALRNASGNFIGVDPAETSSAAFSNVISGNRSHGIDIFVGSNNQILGNLIGTNTNGTAVLSNGGDGVLISTDAPATSGNQVGASTSQYTRNVISGNAGAGVRISGEAADTNKVQNNYIGPRQNGFLLLNGGAPPLPVFAQTAGVIIENGADSNQIGGTGSERNIVSGNNGAGVRINGSANSNATASGNQILGNVIGLSIPNLAPSQISLGNASHGIFLNGAAGPINSTVITGNTVAASGTGAQTGNGIYILSNNSDVVNTTIQRNAVGVLGSVAAPLNPSGSTGPSANDGDGIRIEQTIGSTKKLNSLTIGGTAYADRNIVSNNLANGINVLGNATKIYTLTLQRNTVQSNVLNGVTIDNTVNSQVDGQDAAQPNLIASNGDNGIRFTGSTTVTVRYNTVQLNGDNGVTISGSGMWDVTLESNKVLTNTLDGIVGTGSSTNTFIAGNLVQNHNGSGIRWDGPATDTQISGNTVYTNTKLAVPEAHGIWLGSGLRAIVSGNQVRGNTTGAGIVVGSLTEVAITANAEVDRNGLEGIRVTGASKPQIAGNTVISNTLQVAGLGGIVLAGTTEATVSGNTVRGHLADPGIVISGATASVLQSNTVTKNQLGLDVTGGFNTAVRGGSYSSNTLSGAQVTGTDLLTMTQKVALSSNGASGARILGSTTRVTLSDVVVLNNAVNGVQVGAGGGGPHPQRVSVVQSSISGNGIPRDANGTPTIPLPVAPAYLGLGIVFNPDGPPESAANPNHDINPPSSVALSSNGVVTGRVSIADAVSGCLPAAQCKVEVFRANPASRDGQGRDFLGAGLADATGAFTVTVGTLPVQLALTATDGTGNTSRFGLFTGSPDLSIAPARSASARPSEVITYTHDVVNTGNMTFTNLQLSASSSRGWDQITISPTGQFTLKPGETKTITVSVKLPSGADPRVAAGGSPDSLTVTVQGSVQFEGEASPRVVSRSVVDVTTVLPRVVLEVVPNALSGRGLPGSVLPYVHTVRNNGNVAATVSLTASTNLGAAWATSVTPSGNVTIQPGAQQVVQVLVSVPPASTGVTSGTVALTTLRVDTVSPLDATQNRVVTDTTTVTLDQAASLITDEVVDGAADEVATIQHRATNLSNGQATFRLAYSSSLGSTVTFRSATNGVTIGANNTFTLGTQSNSAPPYQFDFFADVKVNRNALPGQKDSIIIFLLDSRGNVVGGAFVRDTVNVTRAIIAPRVYMPVMAK